MIQIEYLALLLTGLGLTASILYYAMVLKNANKTRQAQLFSTLHETFRSQEFRSQWTMILKQEWTDFDDFWEKYGLENNPEEWSDWQAVASFFHGIGVLLKQGLLEIEVLEELLASTVLMGWVMMGPILKGFEEYIERGSVRTRFRDVEGLSVSRRFRPWSGFEYLYTELCKREEQATLKT